MSAITVNVYGSHDKLQAVVREHGVTAWIEISRQGDGFTLGIFLPNRDAADKLAACINSIYVEKSNGIPLATAG